LCPRFSTQSPTSWCHGYAIHRAANPGLQMDVRIRGLNWVPLSEHGHRIRLRCPWHQGLGIHFGHHVGAMDTHPRPIILSSEIDVRIRGLGSRLGARTPHTAAVSMAPGIEVVPVWWCHGYAPRGRSFGVLKWMCVSVDWDPVSEHGHRIRPRCPWHQGLRWSQYGGAMDTHPSREPWSLKSVCVSVDWTGIPFVGARTPQTAAVSMAPGIEVVPVWWCHGYAPRAVSLGP
jgi:hypothetical protein